MGEKMKMARGRKQKNPGYDPNLMMQELLDTIAESYIGADGYYTESSLQKIAQEFDMTRLKVRKLLITAGAYSSDISEEVNRLKAEKKSVQQIMEITGLGRSSVYSYLPYSRTAYNADELSLDAKRCRKYRERKLAVEKLKQLTDQNAADAGQQLWHTIVLFENYTFYTAKGLKFCYTVQGQEIFVNRKKKSITRSSVDMAYEKVKEMKAAGEPVNGPKKLGTFGASYLFPVFQQFGVIEPVQNVRKGYEHTQ
jgi:hypothetical protein